MGCSGFVLIISLQLLFLKHKIVRSFCFEWLIIAVSFSGKCDKDRKRVMTIVRFLIQKSTMI